LLKELISFQKKLIVFFNTLFSLFKECLFEYRIWLTDTGIQVYINQKSIGIYGIFGKSLDKEFILYQNNFISSIFFEA
jgi:hypothetical protein